MFEVVCGEGGMEAEDNQMCGSGDIIREAKKGGVIRWMERSISKIRSLSGNHTIPAFTKHLILDGSELVTQRGERKPLCTCSGKLL